MFWYAVTLLGNSLTLLAFLLRFIRYDWSSTQSRANYALPLREDLSVSSTQRLANHQIFQSGLWDRHCSQSCVHSVHMASNSLESFFSQSWVISHTCALISTLLSIQGIPFADLQSTLWVALFLCCSALEILSVQLGPDSRLHINSPGAHLGSSSLYRNLETLSS